MRHTISKEDIDSNRNKIRNRKLVSHQQAVEGRAESPAQSQLWQQQQQEQWHWLQIGSILAHCKWVMLRIKWHLRPVKWLLGGPVSFYVLPLAYFISTSFFCVVMLLSALGSVNMDDYRHYSSLTIDALIFFPLAFAPTLFLHFIIT